MQPSDSLASFGRSFGSPRPRPTPGAGAYFADCLGDRRMRLQTRQFRRNESPALRHSGYSRGKARASRVTGLSSSYAPWCNIPPDTAPPRPYFSFEKIYGEAAIAFGKFRPLGIRNEYSFRDHVPTARTLAYLRFASLVTEAVARLATGSGGLTPRRAGFAPAGQKTKFHGVIAHPPIPIDQQSLVALYDLSPPPVLLPCRAGRQGKRPKAEESRMPKHPSPKEIGSPNAQRREFEQDDRHV
jgi:hypothetical protein